MPKNTQKSIKKSKYNAKQVADYFIFLSSKKMVDENTSEGVTPLKLQKLLYFGQAASLSLLNKELFNDDIEAWKFGPVVSSIYFQYKKKQNLAISKASGIYKQLDEDTSKFVGEVFELFDKYSAGELVEITHRHAPWKNYYKEGQNVVIPSAVLRDYYKHIFVLSDSNEQA